MERVTHVMVPLDGSAASEEALPIAVAVARRTRARMALVHVPEDTYGSEGISSDYPAGLVNELHLSRDIGIEVKRLPGPVSDELVLFAKQAGVDLIVMTSRGRGGMKRALCGSVADAVIRRSDRPVLLVKRSPAELPPVGAGSVAPFRRILIPLDGTPVAEAVIPHVIAVTGVAGVQLILLRVHPALTPDGRIEPGPPLGQRDDAQIDVYLSTLAARVSSTGIAVASRAVVHASNADTIMAVATKERVDLIAMATSGAGGADRLLFGSVADAVVRQAEQDVLVVRPPDADH